MFTNENGFIVRRNRLFNSVRGGLFADKGEGGEGEGGGAGGAGDDKGNKDDKGSGSGQSFDPAKIQAQFEDFQGQINALKNKNDELISEKRKAQERAEREAQERAKASGDVEAIEKSWQKKFETREQELSSALAERDKMIQNVTAGAKANEIANEIAVTGSAKALLPHISQRLKTEIRDGQPVTVVLDANGKPSAQTVDELKSEFMNDPAFAPLIVGSKANGAGGAGKGSAGGGNTVTESRLEKMSQKEKTQFFKENPNITVIDG